MPRLAYFVSHPIQYQAPLLRLLAAEPDIELKVFFYSDFSVQAYYDPQFGQAIKWDVPLLAGYDHQFLECWGSKQRQNLIRQPIARNICQELKQGQFDAVWIHGWHWLCSLQALLAAEHLNIPILLRGESNGLRKPSQSLKHSLKDWAKNRFLEWLFAKISGFLCVGSFNRQFYQDHGINESRLFSVPYAVDNSFFQEQAQLASYSQKELRQSLNLQPNRPIILFAAKLIEKKRPQDLLAAYRLLSVDGNREPEPYLLFVGDGNLRSHLEAEVKTTGWESIRFLGFRNQSEMPKFYNLCDVFVLPSDFEPWGLAINEVMNAGKAVVVSDRVGCAPDLIKDGGNGRIFPTGDITALAEAMQWAIANRDSAGEIALKRIQNWSFKQDIQGVKQALERLKTGVA
ncbi:MAG TPA: glycosyltransferase family 4 protein [Coleofasciculaceae cyanobacterium]|jgi:glycosyltransferase involved in cell wall biosynthesis